MVGLKIGGKERGGHICKGRDKRVQRYKSIKTERMWGKDRK